MRRIDFPKLRSILLDTIINRQPVQTLLERVYGCVSLPIICFDVQFQIVAYAFPRPFYYSHWENMATDGHAPDDVVVSNNYLLYQQMMYEMGKSQVFDWGTSSGYPQACGPVMSGRQLVGYVGMMLEDALPKDCVEANDMLSQAISVLLKDGGSMRRGDLAGGFSAEQLLITDGLSAELGARFGRTFAPNYIYVVLSSSEPNVSKLQYVLSTLANGKKPVIGCLNGEKYLCLLYHSLDAPVCLPALCNCLETIASRYAITAGVSDYFNDPLRIPNSRMQAMLTMSVGSACCSGSHVFHFRDYYSDIVSYCAIESLGPSACLLPEIMTLAGEDTRGNCYMRTLELYLNSFHSHSAVAAGMGLHKNTVINRMRKIQDILGQNPDDCIVADKLLTGINVYHLLERSGRLPARRDSI